MARLRVRNKILEAVGMFMLEKGKVLSKHEYDGYANEVPIGSGMALNHFGSWSRLTTTLEGTFPTLWLEIQEAMKPPPPPKPTPEPKAKPKPAAAVKAPAEKKEPKDE